MPGKSFLHLGMMGALLVLTSWGCGVGGNKPPMGKVHGKVTYKGSPVTRGTISFSPLEGKGANAGNPAIGIIESDGSFELTTFDTGDGALQGQHRVTVNSMSEGKAAAVSDSIPSQRAEDLKLAGAQLPQPLVPTKYMDPEKTPLKYTVRAGDNNFEIDLKD